VRRQVLKKALKPIENRHHQAIPGIGTVVGIHLLLMGAVERMVEVVRATTTGQGGSHHMVMVLESDPVPAVSHARIHCDILNAYLTVLFRFYRYI